MVTACCRLYLIPCTKIERIYDASDKCLVVNKALGHRAKEVHFIYSEKFRNRLLLDSQHFIEKIPVYEEVVQYLKGQWIKKHPETSALKKGWNGRTNTKITEKISETVLQENQLCFSHCRR